MTKTLSWAAGTVARPWSAELLHLLAVTLHAASGLLARVAEKMTAVETAVARPHVVEYHPIYRDAGAPEGALYVDGVLVGVIEGVPRL